MCASCVLWAVYNAQGVPAYSSQSVHASAGSHPPFTLTCPVHLWRGQRTPNRSLWEKVLHGLPVSHSGSWATGRHGRERGGWTKEEGGAGTHNRPHVMLCPTAGTAAAANTSRTLSSSKSLGCKGRYCSPPLVWACETLASAAECSGKTVCESAAVIGYGLCARGVDGMLLLSMLRACKDCLKTPSAPQQ